MNTKNILLSILLILCNLSVTAQDTLLFTPAQWDFGTIREAEGKVSHTFTGENRGEQPVVILDVVTSCGCTVPSFTKKPILPGEKTEIRVTYDPANRPGSFSKALAVYSSEKRKVTTLTITGNVLPREKTVGELYPVDAGSGLRLTTTTCPLSYIYIGRNAQTSVGYINTSNRTLTLDLRKTEPSGLLTLNYPRQITPGERGEINLSYFIAPDSPRYGTVKDVLTVGIDGRPSRTQLLVHGIAVDDPGKAADNRAPKAQLSENIIKFGPVKRAAAMQSQSFTLTNEGTAPLIVRAVETPQGIGCSLRPGDRIAPGQSATAEVTLDPSQQDYGLVSSHLILITNDPQRPMRRVRATAVIEQ